MASSWPGSTMASGSRWTPCATSTCSRSYGPRAVRPGKCGTDFMTANVDPAFWRGKRVFITGHTGFKGGWLSLWLQHLGAQVQGYALAPEGPHALFVEARV